MIELQLHPDPLLRDVAALLVDGGDPEEVRTMIAKTAKALTEMGAGGGAEVLMSLRPPEASTKLERILLLHRELEESIDSYRRAGHGHPAAWKRSSAALLELQYAFAVLFVSHQLECSTNSPIVIVDDQPELARYMLGYRNEPRMNGGPIFPAVLINPGDYDSGQPRSLVDSLLQLDSVLALVIDIHFGHGWSHSGLDLLRALRSSDVVESTSRRFEAVPVIVMSGFGDELTVAAAFWSGADGYVVKPTTGGVFQGFIDHPEPLLWVCLADVLYARYELSRLWKHLCDELTRISRRVLAMTLAEEEPPESALPAQIPPTREIPPLPQGMTRLASHLHPLKAVTRELEEALEERPPVWAEIGQLLHEAHSQVQDFQGRFLDADSFSWLRMFDHGERGRSGKAEPADQRAELKLAQAIRVVGKLTTMIFKTI